MTSPGCGLYAKGIIAGYNLCCVKSFCKDIKEKRSRSLNQELCIVHFSRKKWSHILCDDCATKVVDGTFTRTSDLFNLEMRNGPICFPFNDSKRFCSFKKSLTSIEDEDLEIFDKESIEAKISKEMSILEKKWKRHMNLLIGLEK